MNGKWKNSESFRGHFNILKAIGHIKVLHKSQKVFGLVRQYEAMPNIGHTFTISFKVKHIKKCPLHIRCIEDIRVQYFRTYVKPSREHCKTNL